MKEYHAKFVAILQIIYQWERLAYFSNCIAITFNLVNKGKKINWCSIMLMQMSIKLARRTEHHKQIVARLITPNKKASTCYFGPIIEVCLQHWFPLLKEDTLVDSPKPQSIEEREKKKVVEEQSKEPFLEVVIKKQFINERWSMHSTNRSPWPIQQS